MKNSVQLVTDIMGTKIKTPAGEDIGVVQNVMLNPRSGEIVYIVLCYANFFGKSNRHLAMPRTCLAIREEHGSSFYFEIEKETLEKVLKRRPSVLHKDCVYELSQEATEFIPKQIFAN
ncbi:PRC-barrel domain-containing protein [Halalkalibaculum sp. DA3122]|uniref:PRC-barrel domain-containing protein n=1 Tax=unclassified Halalkalibaculum TaxID=2964617 RepID=UPI003753EAF9